MGNDELELLDGQVKRRTGRRLKERWQMCEVTYFVLIGGHRWAPIRQWIFTNLQQDSGMWPEG